MSLDDSGDDLFITQSSFRKESLEINTQDANSAADFLLDVSFSTENLQGNSPVKSVASSDTPVDIDNKKCGVDSTPFVPLLPDFFEEGDAEKVPDDVLSAAVDAVMTDNPDYERFGKPVSAAELDSKSKKGYSDATKRKLQWAFRVYFDWKVARNCRAIQENQADLFIGDIFDMDAAKMCQVLSRFVLEVRKKNGEVYPSDTLYELLVSLQMYLNLHGRDVKFIDDPVFKPLRNTLDNEMQQLAKEGKHCPRQKAEVISIEDENRLWTSQILGDGNPKQLLDTLLFQLGMHFALRAGSEHRDLRLGPNSQLSVKYDSQADLEYLEYIEDTSKNNRGGLAHRRVDNKVVCAYANKANPERCIVRLFRKYVSLRPKDKCPNDFYLRPLTNFTDSVWYSIQPVGKNKLSTIVASMAKEIGLKGKITNHSLRATAASRLYQSNIDEQLVMERTGHRSNAVRSYKRTSQDQLHNISTLLYGEEVEGPPPAKKVCTSPKKGNASCKPVVETCTHDDRNDGSSSSKISVSLTINLPKTC